MKTKNTIEQTELGLDVPPATAPAKTYRAPVYRVTLVRDGSVTAEDLRVALEKQGHSFEKKQVRIKDSLKTLGTHQVDLEIYPQVKTTIS